MSPKDVRPIPEWLIQVAWWGSGIFATGATWYFLSTKDYGYAAISFLIGIVVAGIAILLHRKKDAYALALLPVELKTDLPDDYVRRSVERPEQIRPIQTFPEVKEIVRRSCSEGWDSGITLEMREANFEMIDFLESVWLKLAEFYPRKHFGGTSAEKYIEKYVRDRFAFHWAKHEPNGPGTGGTIAGVLTGGGVIRDIEELIKEMMRSLFFDCSYLNLDEWLRRWGGVGEERGAS